jgi:hypothetical protein
VDGRVLYVVSSRLAEYCLSSQEAWADLVAVTGSDGSNSVAGIVGFLEQQLARLCTSSNANLTARELAGASWALATLRQEGLPAAARVRVAASESQHHGGCSPRARSILVAVGVWVKLSLPPESPQLKDCSNEDLISILWTCGSYALQHRGSDGATTGALVSGHMSDMELSGAQDALVSELYIVAVHPLWPDQWKQMICS